MKGADLASLERAAGALEQEGRWSEVEETASRLFDAAVARGVPGVVPSALRRQARSLSALGRTEEAREIAQLSWEVAERQGDLQAAARAINLLATVSHVEERLDEAGTLYEVALEAARSCRDDELIGLVCLNLGVVRHIRGDLRGARLLYLESIAAAVRSGDRSASVMAYSNLGRTCSAMEEWQEAELFLGRAIEMADDLRHMPLMALLSLCIADPLIHVGDLRRAAESLDRAEELAGRIQDREILAAVPRLRAQIARVRGEYGGAEAHLETALNLTAGMELLGAETQTECFRLRWAQGRKHEAIAALMRARDAYRALGAERDARNVEAMLASALAERHSSDAAAQLAAL
jgi:tetratricopeptide (TPR) repeat protein